MFRGVGLRKKAAPEKSVKVEAIDSCPVEKLSSFLLEYILSGIFYVLDNYEVETTLAGLLRI
jgi:hypothetical protein